MYSNVTNVYDRNVCALNKAFKGSKRIALNQGGTSSSKTFSIMQMLVTLAFYTPIGLISVVSESFPHLQRGCIRDFRNILGDSFDESRFNKTRSIYDFGKSQIEFFSADQPEKCRGGRRKVLYINECNNIAKFTFDELQVRTEIFTILDYNPVAEFWGTEMKDLPEVEFIHSTYLDAKDVLPKSIVDNIEMRRERDPNWWRVYGLGEIGNIEGLVHPSFTTIDQMPEGGIVVYGLDFGYTNDPTALTHNTIKGDNLYSDQLIYEAGLTNDAIARRMESLGVRKHYDLIYADGAEPKSIAEIARHGFNIKAAPKGADSVIAGIQKLNQYKQHWTKRSLDAIKEQRNYRFIETDDGKITNKPMDDFNHLMDSRRYAVFGKTTVNEGTAARIAI